MNKFKKHCHCNKNNWFLCIPEYVGFAKIKQRRYHYFVWLLKFPGPDCRDCSTVCLNGGEVDRETCTCNCPGNRMQLPRCECKKKYRGQNCSQCQFTQCRPCGEFDWEKCQCSCQPGFGGRNCDGKLFSNCPLPLFWERLSLRQCHLTSFDLMPLPVRI